MHGCMTFKIEMTPLSRGSELFTVPCAINLVMEDFYFNYAPLQPTTPLNPNSKILVLQSPPTHC